MSGDVHVGANVACITMSKRTMHPTTNSLAYNSLTGRHKIQGPLYTRGFIWLRVRCILLAAVAACFMFARVLGFTCEIHHHGELCSLENRLSCTVVQMYFKYYSCISADLFFRVCQKQ